MYYNCYTSALTNRPGVIRPSGALEWRHSVLPEISTFFPSVELSTTNNMRISIEFFQSLLYANSNYISKFMHYSSPNQCTINIFLNTLLLEFYMLITCTKHMRSFVISFNFFIIQDFTHKSQQLYPMSSL